MWWFDVHRFNPNDPTTFGHINDGKDDMMLTYADITRVPRMITTKNRVTALQGQIAKVKKLNEKLNESLELELSTLRKLESEDKAAEDRRAKEKQQRETKEKIERDLAEILQALEQDKTDTDRLNALNALHGGKPAPYRHTLRTAYDTVVARHVPLVDVTKYGTPVRYVPDGSEGVVIPCPVGKPLNSFTGEPFVYYMTKGGFVWGAHKKNVRAL